MLAGVICYCKMTSVLTLDGVASCLCLKEVTNTSVRNSPTIGGKLEEAEAFKSVFAVYCVLESK